MDVQLEAEPIFQAGAVISGVLEIVQDDLAAFGLRDIGELAQVRLVSRIVEKILAGLVPVRGRSPLLERLVMAATTFFEVGSASNDTTSLPVAPSPVTELSASRSRVLNSSA